MLSSTPHFLWVTEFPLFSSHDEDKEFLTRGRKWSSTHHPFTAPMYEDLPAFYAGDYARVRAQHYDIVLNGVEIGGGSVRIHDPAMQEYVFRDVLQVSFSFHHPCTRSASSGCGVQTPQNSCAFERREISYCTEPSGHAFGKSWGNSTYAFIFPYSSRVLFFLSPSLPMCAPPTKLSLIALTFVLLAG